MRVAELVYGFRKRSCKRRYRMSHASSLVCGHLGSTMASSRTLRLRPGRLSLTVTYPSMWRRRPQAQRQRPEWGVCSFIFEPNRVHAKRLQDLQASYTKQARRHRPSPPAGLWPVSLSRRATHDMMR